MQLDVHTLSLATVFVMALLGVLLAFAGMQNRTVRAPAFWGAAYVAGAVAVGLIAARGSIPNWLSINIANALALVSLGLVWVGMRVFDRRPVRVAPEIAILVVPVALWLLACAAPAFRADINLRIVLMAALGALPATLSARDVWRGRSEPLMSRRPTVWVLSAYAAVSLARIPVTVAAPLSDGRLLLSGAWLGMLTFGNLLFTMVLAFLLLTMIKERSELKHKIASLTDPLSGVGNRRAFFKDAERLRQSVGREPLAVMMFDLDRFKSINDHFGHGTGDAVLKIFAATASRILGETAVFGRIGGEEFATVLPVADLDEAVSVADRVRRDFAAAAADYGYDAFSPSVSAGVVLARDPRQVLRDVLASADAALYCAKAAGRNRVEASDASKQAFVPLAETDPRNRRAHRPREAVNA
jgi:diguanylate cyclase (GGDEF)-like protein